VSSTQHKNTRTCVCVCVWSLLTADMITPVTTCVADYLRWKTHATNGLINAKPKHHAPAVRHKLHTGYKTKDSGLAQMVRLQKRSQKRIKHGRNQKVPPPPPAGIKLPSVFWCCWSWATKYIHPACKIMHWPSQPNQECLRKEGQLNNSYKVLIILSK